MATASPKLPYSSPLNNRTKRKITFAEREEAQYKGYRTLAEVEQELKEDSNLRHGRLGTNAAAAEQHLDSVELWRNDEFARGDRNKNHRVRAARATVNRREAMKRLVWKSIRYTTQEVEQWTFTDAELGYEAPPLGPPWLVRK